MFDNTFKGKYTKYVKKFVLSIFKKTMLSGVQLDIRLPFGINRRINRLCLSLVHFSNDEMGKYNTLWIFYLLMQFHFTMSHLNKT